MPSVWSSVLTAGSSSFADSEPAAGGSPASPRRSTRPPPRPGCTRFLPRPHGRGEKHLPPREQDYPGPDFGGSPFFHSICPDEADGTLTKSPGNADEKRVRSERLPVTLGGRGFESRRSRHSPCTGAYIYPHLSAAYTVGSTRERKTLLICDGVNRPRRSSHHVKTERKAAVR